MIIVLFIMVFFVVMFVVVFLLVMMIMVIVFFLLILLILNQRIFITGARPVHHFSNCCIPSLPHPMRMFNIWCLFVWSSFGYGGGGMQIFLMHPQQSILLALFRTRSRIMEVPRDLLHSIFQGNLLRSLMNIQHCRHHVHHLYEKHHFPLKWRL